MLIGLKVRPGSEVSHDDQGVDERENGERGAQTDGCRRVEQREYHRSDDRADQSEPGQA